MMMNATIVATLSDDRMYSCEYHGLVSRLRVNLLKEGANVPISPYEWTLVALMSKRKTRKTSEMIQVC